MVDTRPGTWLMCRCLRYLSDGDDVYPGTWLMYRSPRYLADVSVSDISVCCRSRAKNRSLLFRLGRPTGAL